MAKVPGLGEVPKPVLIIGGIGGVAVTAYLYMKHKAAASQAAATPPRPRYRIWLWVWCLWIFESCVYCCLNSV